MRVLPTLAHGWIDYLSVASLIAIPLVGTFGSSMVAFYTVMAVLILVMSLLTRYEYSVVKLIPMRVHLTLDFIAGVLFVIAPFVLRHPSTPAITEITVLVGVFSIIVSLITQTEAPALSPGAESHDIPQTR